MSVRNLPVLTPSRKVDGQLFDISLFRKENGVYPEHLHDCIELVFIASGSAVHRGDGELRPAIPGSVFLVPVGSRHGLEEIRNLELYNISCSPDILESLGVDLTILRENNSALHGKLGVLQYQFNVMEQYNARKLLAEMYEEFYSPGTQYQIKLRSLFTLLLVMLARAEVRTSAGSPDSMDRLEVFLKKHFRDSLTLEVLSERICLSPSQLIRRFRARYDTTPMAYLRELRLNEAGRMLISGRFSMHEIAASVGFTDGNYFIRCFHRLYGMSPGRFRRSYGPDRERLSAEEETETETESELEKSPVRKFHRRPRNG